MTTERPTSLYERFSARIYDPFLWLAERGGMAQRRRDLLASARGRVLEIGAGTGLNVRHYPPGIDELVLTEPVASMARRLERRAARHDGKPRVVVAPAERLPFPDNAFDTVVSTLVLCTVPEPDQALAEIRRVLKPDGALLFIEHLRSDVERWGRWQDRLERPWAAFASGCRCNRNTLDLLGESGMHLAELDRRKWRGMPRVVRPLAIGSARIG
ncbi:MAG TPA: class I SAM-dependent methyltransferase [Thermoleophilaceae bacterium]